MGKLEDYIKNRSEKSPQFSKLYKEESRRLDVALAVKNLRTTLGMSQREFAKYIGKPQSTIGRIETGKVNVSLDVLNEIAIATGTKLEIKYVTKSKV